MAPPSSQLYCESHAVAFVTLPALIVSDTDGAAADDPTHVPEGVRAAATSITARGVIRVEVSLGVNALRHVECQLTPSTPPAG